MTLHNIPGLSSDHSKAILDLFACLPEDSEVWLFGSRAKGNYREGSDIDLALKGSHVRLEHRDTVLRDYENLFLPWKLDIVLHSQIDEPALLSHLDRVGLLLFKK